MKSLASVDIGHKIVLAVTFRLCILIRSLILVGGLISSLTCDGHWSTLLLSASNGTHF